MGESCTTTLPLIGLMALGNLWFQFPEILVSLNYRVHSILLKILYSSLPDIVLSFWMLILSYFYFSDKKEQGKGKFQWCIIISYIHIYSSLQVCIYTCNSFIHATRNYLTSFSGNLLCYLNKPFYNDLIYCRPGQYLYFFLPSSPKKLNGFSLTVVTLGASQFYWPDFLSSLSYRKRVEKFGCRVGMRFQLRGSPPLLVWMRRGSFHVALGAAGTFPVVTLSRVVEPGTPQSVIRMHSAARCNGSSQKRTKKWNQAWS